MKKEADIGIVGAGVAGLHLGLFLKMNGVSVTIYTNKTADELREGRLPNTVAHHHNTRHRERHLGVNFWDGPEYGYCSHYHYINAEDPLHFRGDFNFPSCAVDYRLYLPALMKEFENRGGTIKIADLQEEDIDQLSTAHDLIVVAAGKGSFKNLFSRVAEHSPFTSPQRNLCAGLYSGVEYPNPRGTTISTSPGHGDLLEIPVYSFSGHVTALLFENVPEGDLDPLSKVSPHEDQSSFEELVLEKLKRHHKATYERVDRDTFGLTDTKDIIQGSLTPEIRESYVHLANGTYAVSVGDAHMTVDPIVGQGANAASYSAWVLGQTILEEINYDIHFCEKVALRRWEYLSSVSNWVNFMIGSPTPEPHLVELMTAMSSNKEIANDFTNNFNDPIKQWDILASPERTKQYLNQFKAYSGEVRPSGVSK
ncbi:styrene monooxygenase/indole monooxygenase family protein [Salibacterium sp. K-3]